MGSGGDTPYLQLQGSTNILGDTLEELKDQLSSDEKIFFKNAYQNFFEINDNSKYFKFGLIGSSYYVSELIDTQNIMGIINLETVGYTDNKPGSQINPKGLDPQIIPKNNTSENLSVGDFIFILSNDISQKLGELFFNATKDEKVSLPSAWVHAPYDFETIKKLLHDILRSDHAPFWRNNIPGLMISDSAKF